MAEFIKGFGSRWAIEAALLIAAVFLRFGLRGYSYLAHTLTLIAALIFLHYALPAGLWRWVIIVISAGFMYFCLCEILIIPSSKTDADSGRRYLVVLGAEVNGSVPSRSLRYRIDAAFEYLTANPDSVAIVSGGQGEHEEKTEALCMFEELTKLGISPERIIQEDRATSTLENLSYSYDIIRSLGDEPDGNVAVLSSSYHLYRAKKMSEGLGVKAAGVAAYPGNPFLALNFFIREAFGVTHLWLLGS